MKLFNKILFTLSVVLLSPVAAFSQEAEASSAISQNFVLMAIVTVLALTIIVLIAVIYVLSSLRNSIKEQENTKKAEAGIEVVETPGWWTIFMGKMTDEVPIEEEDSILLDHNYDGIQELDNHLPPWWKYLFYLTIVFGIVYLLNYHIFNVSPLSDEEYQIEVAEAQAQAEARQAAMATTEDAIDESNIQFSDDPTHLSNGEQIFVRQCASCHMADGGGGIGPNLTDEFWLHGGSMADIYSTIKVGVPDKGMISWEPLLSPTQIRDVSSYIMTMVGTTPANPKAPQGDRYIPETLEEPASETDSAAVDSEEGQEMASVSTP